jgi:hypothetical protein
VLYIYVTNTCFLLREGLRANRLTKILVSQKQIKSSGWVADTLICWYFTVTGIGKLAGKILVPVYIFNVLDSLSIFILIRNLLVFVRDAFLCKIL